MSVEIREVHQRELARVGDLTAHAYLTDDLLAADDDYVGELRDAVRRSRVATVLVAAVESAVVGTVTVATHGSGYTEVAREGEAEVRMLAVDPAARGQGLGERLMRAGVQAALDAGAERVVLATTPAMERAQRLYERMGLRRAPERDTEIDGEVVQVYVVDRP